MLYIADISEFQGDVDMGTYADENPAIIIRAHNTMRVDNKWVRNIVAADANPKIRWVAAYQYLTGTADPVAAARAFAAAIGPYRVDLVILDDEEGVGDQQGRQQAWRDTLTGHPEWTYSGDYFARTHGLHPEWVAAYQQNEPTAAHRLWQCTDKRTFAGIAAPCDGSLFHGTVDDLIALTSGTPLPASVEEDMPPAPAIVCTPTEEYSFVRGTNGALYVHRLHADPGNWVSLGGIITSGPAAVLYLDGRIIVNARGQDGTTWRVVIRGEQLVDGKPANPLEVVDAWKSIGGLS